MRCAGAVGDAASPRCASAAAKRWRSRSRLRRLEAARASHPGATMKISDARAVVTGGASGLGLAVARHLVAAGGKVALLDVQEGPGRAAAAALGSGAAFLRCDVTSETEVNTAMDAAQAHLGGLNLLVNCAGVVGAGRML